MTKHVLLNNVNHKDTKVITHYAARYGDDQASVLAFPSEFIELQKHYPIFFRRDGEFDGYQCVVLLGLEKNENLFLDASYPSGWKADYVPAVLNKGPFLIGFQQSSHSEEKNAVIHIDMDHPKVSNSEGQSLFLTHGGNSPYLNHISSCLSVIDSGLEIQSDMFKQFLALDLIEPVNIEFELNNGEKRRLSGNYTIHEERLAALTGSELQALSKSGYLQLAFAVVASMTNVRKLINLKNLYLSQ